MVQETVTRASIGVKIGLTGGLLVLVHYFPQYFGVPYIDSHRQIHIMTPGDLDIRFPFGLFKLWLVVSIWLNVVLWTDRRWDRRTRWAEFGLGLGGAYILWRIFQRAEAAFQRNGIPLPGIDNPDLQVFLGHMCRVALAIAIVLTLITSAKRLYRLRGSFPVESLSRATEHTAKMKSDQRWGGFERTLRRDLRNVYNFYLDDKAREELATMGPVGKAFHLVFWVMKSMIQKLTPTRRILLVAGLITPTIGVEFGDTGLRFGGIGFVLILLVLLLELKDKLTALDELAVGRAVQNALLPSANPNVSGWEVWLHTQPANEVGGDLVDYLEVREKTWGVALGDVAGKGLGAALLMAKVQATLRALAPSYASLADLARELNHIIYRDGLRNRFVSFVYLELESGSGGVRFVNAGHLPPILVRGDVLQSMPRGAPALGILPEATYNEEEIELDPGDLFCIFSDGVTEATNEKGQFFGEARLMSLLEKHPGFSAKALGEQILSEVKAFISEEPPSDDLSLALLKRVK